MHIIDNIANDSFIYQTELCRKLGNRNLLRKWLEKHWEFCLSIYKKTTEDYIIDQNRYPSPFLQIQVAFDYNYLFLAKIVDFLCKTRTLQYTVRKLTKQELEYRHTEDFLAKKSQQPSLFASWLSRLWIEQFNRYIRRCTLYLAKVHFILDWRHIHIRYFPHSLLLNIKDLLILKLYYHRTILWHNCILCDKNKEKELLDNLYDCHQRLSNISYSESTIKLVAKNISSEKDKVFFARNMFDIRTQFTKIGQKEYVNLIKYCIRCNTSNIQIHLIQKINNIIRLWYRSFSNIVKKYQYKKFNDMLSHYLFLWGNARHHKHPAKWIKKHYWYHFYDSSYFCLF